MLLIQVPPRGGLPTLAQLLQGHAPGLAIGIVAFGGLLWIVTYILAIRIGFRQKTYAIPFLAVCLNITWELAHTVIFLPEGTIDLITHAGWLAIDAVILWQVLRFGRKYETAGIMKEHFRTTVLAIVAVVFVAQVSFQHLWNANAIFPDQDGAITAFLINLIMSILFVELVHRRPNLEGLSLGVAWTKMLGSLCYSIGNLIALRSIGYVAYEVQYRPAGASEWVAAGQIGSMNIRPEFLYLLFSLTLFFDILYIALLIRRRRRRARTAA